MAKLCLSSWRFHTDYKSRVYKDFASLVVRFYQYHFDEEEDDEDEMEGRKNTRMRIKMAEKEEDVAKVIPVPDDQETTG